MDTRIIRPLPQPAHCKCCTSSRRGACLPSEKQDSAADVTDQGLDIIIKLSGKESASTWGSLLKYRVEIEAMSSCKAPKDLMACEPGLGTCLSTALLCQGGRRWLWQQGNAGLCGCGRRPGLDCAKLGRKRCLTGGFSLSLCKGPVRQPVCTGS